MTDSQSYQQQYGVFNDDDCSYQHVILPHHSNLEMHANRDHSVKSRHRLSLSALLQKRSLAGRRFSFFGLQQHSSKTATKQSLKIMIPETMKRPKSANSDHAANNYGIERLYTNSTTTTSSNWQTTTISSDDDENLKTPSTNSTISSTVTRRSSMLTITTEELQTFISETRTCSDHRPLKDYSGKGYSNFYIKLSNGNWMVRVRDGNRNIVGTFEVDGRMV